MKFYFFRIYILIFVLILSSCNTSTTCHYSDEFGESANRDNIQVFSRLLDCNYNLAENISSTRQSSTIVKCLKEDNCSSFGENIENNGVEENNKLRECVEKCQRECESDSGSSLWVRANVKDDGDYFGIKMEEDSFITIDVTGNISLSTTNIKKEAKYKKTGIKEVDYSFIVENNEYLDLNLNYSDEIIKNIKNIKDIDNLKKISILSLKNINSALVDNTKLKSGDYSGAYKFQEPMFQYINCELGNKGDKNDSGFNSVICGFNFENVNNSLKDILKEHYNKYYKNNSILVFDGDYYMYDSAILNNIKYMKKNINGIFEPVIKGENDKKLLKISDDGREILYTKNYKDLVAGYLWNNDNNEFYIETNDPVKIAIKYIGSDPTICDISSSVDNYYQEASSGEKNEKFIDNITKSYSLENYNFSGASETNDNEWKVLKTSVGNNIKTDIIFNQFSVPDRKIKAMITLKIENGNCNKGLLIYPIKLKDYVVKNNGLLFFYTPKVSTNNEIKYSLINQDIMRSNISGLNNKIIKLEEFYDYSKNYSAFGLDESYSYNPYSVNTIKDNEVINNLDNNKYKDLLNNAIFVRKNQVIRLDYTNWFTLDNNKEITKKSFEFVNESNERKDIDFPVFLNAIIKEQYPYFCINSIKESIDYETHCENENLEYELIKLGVCDVKEDEKCDKLNNKNTVSGYYGRCKVTPKECLVNDGIIEDYIKVINIKKDNDIKDESGNKINVEEEIKKTFREKTISEFFVDSVSRIAEKVEDKDKENLRKLVESSYNKSKECLEYIKNNQVLLYKINNSGSYILQDKTKYNLTNKNITINNMNDAIKELREMFSLKTEKKSENEQNTGQNENISYEHSFKIFKDFNGDVIKVLTPQCYNLENFSGSTQRFIKETFNNSKYDESLIANYGTMLNDHRLLGATKVSLFNESRPGLLTDFKKLDKANCPPDNKDCKAITYGKKISYGSRFTLELYILNFSEESSNIFKNLDNKEINKYFSYDEKSSNIFSINETLNSYNRNGDRLAVIIGEGGSGYGYKGDLNNLTMYIKSKDKGIEDFSNLSIFKEGANSNSTNCNTGKCYLPLIYPDNTNESLYEFNDDGSIMIKENISTDVDRTGIDIAKSDIIKKYLETNNKSQKALYFSIVDTDNNVENNTGSYNINIKESIEEKDNLTFLFKKFFRMILSFIDGNDIKLLKVGESSKNIIDSLVKCTDDNSINGLKCYTYNDKDKKNNGKLCNPQDPDCYLSCVTEDNSTSKGCFVFSDNSGFVENIYKTIITNPIYIILVKLLLILSISFYGFGYFFGMTKYKQSEIIEKILKISFIYFIVGPSGWDFFNKYIATFFKNGIDSILYLIASSFETSLESDVVRAVTNKDYSDKVVLFSSSFKNLELIFSEVLFSKILGLAFSGMVGPLYLYLVMSSVLTYVVSVITSIVIYLTAQIYMSLVFCLFPLVILFMFFKKTDKTFTNWLNILIGFSGQQIFLVTTLSFFNLLIYNFMRNTFSYTVCWLPLLNIELGGFPLAIIQFWKIPGTNILNTGVNSGGENMPSFYSIITFYMVAYIMGKFIKSMTDLGNKIFGGNFSLTDSGTIAGKVSGFAESVKEKADSSLQNTVKTAYKGAARKLLGGKYIENSNKDLKDKTEKRNKFKEKQNGLVDSKMKEYKSSDEFKKDKENARYNAMEKTLRKDKKNGEERLSSFKERYDNASTDEEKKKIIDNEYGKLDKKERNNFDNEEEKDIKSTLNERKKDMTSEAAFELLSNKDSEFHISKYLKDDTKFKNSFEKMNDTERSELIRNFAVSSGFARGYNKDKNDK